MSKLRLDSILAFILIVPFIMTVRIWPEDTPYWLFALIFSGLLSYLFLDVLKLKKEAYEMLKNAMIWALVLVVIVSSFGSEIIVRHQSSPTYNVHDILVQQEIAMRFLLDGKNPYSETYFSTPLENWHYSETEINPALYHFVMQPSYLLFALPFSALTGTILGYFDGRIPLVSLLLLSLLVGFKLLKDGEKRRSFILLLGFNPLMILYTLEGRSDFFMYGFLMTGLYFLYKKKLLLSAALLAFAFTVKQSVWPLFPLYIGYLWFTNKDNGNLYKTIAVFAAVFLSIVLPFFLWDPKAFLDSTIFYLSGNIPNSYPISGYGFGMLLHELGFIKSLKENFPFVIPQVVVGIPLLLGLLRYLKNNLSVKSLILTYGIFLFVYWYFSRYFNNSHVVFLSILFTTAYFWPENES